MESSESKKRRDIDKEKQEDEEEKMEKFYALIKRNEDMHCRFKEIEKEEKAFTAPWNPTFRPEDFMDHDADIKGGKSLQQLPRPPNKKPQGGEGSGTALDLNLSL